MNTTERIVASYFRLCQNCFTYPDGKVAGGNNRQLDLLACNHIGGSQYHKLINHMGDEVMKVFQEECIWENALN